MLKLRTHHCRKIWAGQSPLAVVPQGSQSNLPEVKRIEHMDILDHSVILGEVALSAHFRTQVGRCTQYDIALGYGKRSTRTEDSEQSLVNAA